MRIGNSFLRPFNNLSVLLGNSELSNKTYKLSESRIPVIRNATAIKMAYYQLLMAMARVLIMKIDKNALAGHLI